MVINRLKELHPGIPPTRLFEYAWAIGKMYSVGEVLDVGCNGSILDKYLEEKGFKCVCADPDPEGAYYWNRELRPNFVQVDCVNPPEEWYHKFKYITIISTLEHLVKGDEKRMLIALESCLDKEGKILITVPHSEDHSKEPVLKSQGQWPVWCYNEKSMAALAYETGLRLNSWVVSPLLGDLPIFCAELKR